MTGASIQHSGQKGWPLSDRGRALPAACVLALLLPAHDGFARSDGAAGSARASVIAPIAASPLGDLDFGTVGGVAAGGGSVTVFAGGGEAAYRGAARAVCGNAALCAAPRPADFAISGIAGHAYRVVLPGSVLASADVPGAPAIEISGLTVRTRSRPDAGAKGLLDTGGNDRFAVGGTLILPAGAVPAHYRARIDVLVSYE